MDKRMKILFVILALVFVFMYFSREYFAPDSRVLPPCPAGTFRGKNGLDCAVKGDNLSH